MEDISKIITAIAALLAAVAGLIPVWKSISKKRKRGKILEGMQRLQSIHESLDKIRDLGADRAVIFAGHNSGGVPRPGSPFYTSALYWSSMEESSEVIPSYKNIPVDAAYIQMLIHSEQRGSYHFETEKEAACQLKTYYEFEGVTDSWVFFLGLVEQNFLYMSLAKTGGEFSSRELVPMELEVESIRNQI